MLYAAVMGVTWLLGAPAHFTAALPDRHIDRFDPRIADNEPVRAHLRMLSNVLHLWETQDFGALPRRVREPLGWPAARSASRFAASADPGFGADHPVCGQRGDLVVG